MPPINLRIPDIHCAACVGRITDALRKIPALRDVRVSFATRSAMVEVDETGQGHHTITAEILQVLEGIGYPARVVENLGGGEIQREKRIDRQWLLAAMVSGGMAAILMAGHTPALMDFVLASLAMGFAGRKFLWRAWLSLRSRALTMDVLVSMGTSVAYLTGIVAWANGLASHFYFESAVMILALISLGRYLEARLRDGAGNAVEKLWEGMPTLVRRIRGEHEEIVSADALAVGDMVRIPTGEKVPVDGVARGTTSAWVNDSFWTGQLQWQEARPGQFIPSGVLVEQGALLLEVKKLPAQSSLARFAQMVTQAQASKAAVEALVDRVCGFFVPAVVLMAAATFAGWIFFSGSWAYAAQAAVAVTIIACPCALGLATPMALMVGMGEAARAGILIRHARALEKLNAITTLLWDKTGTITQGKLLITRVVPKNAGEEELLAWACAAEAQANHPVAMALKDEAARRGIRWKEADRSGVIRVERGYGVEMTWERHAVAVGRRDWIARRVVMRPDEERCWDAAGDDGESVVGVALDGKFLGCLFFRDTIRAEAPGVMKELKNLGYSLAIASGDQEAAVGKVARSLGMDDYHFGKDPLQKGDLIAQYQSRGKKVAFVGDGINDAIALGRADLGIAMGTGADIAKEGGDILLTRPDLGGVVVALRVGKSISRVIRQNLFLAFAYNVAMIPLAAFGKIQPALAALAMGLSSLSVVLNALSLRHTSLRSSQ